jgi:sarcosine/dimethylglycine N-methyltransferase
VKAVYFRQHDEWCQMSDTANPEGLTEQGKKVTDHWSNLAVTYDGAIEALRKSNIDLASVKADDLHGLDMIHMGGLIATDELAALANIQPGHRVLDVGCGVGGPARRLANKFGARVTGVELSKKLFETAVALTELVKMPDKVHVLRASALSLPFEDRAFDVVTMQHVAMQIAEKDQLFGELTRTVASRGRLALHEIFSGPGELHYPLAWATDPSMSALEPLSDCTDRLTKLGFEVAEFVDHSEDGRRFHENAIEKFDTALADKTSLQGLPPEVIEKRRAASVVMEKNLATGSLKVGMLIATRSD